MQSQLMEQPVSPEAIKNVMELARQQYRLERQVEDLENNLDIKKKELFDLKHKTLPDAMLDAGLTDLTLAEGITLTNAPFYSASLPKEDLVKRNDAFRWLEDNGYSSLVKTQVICAFQRGQAEEIKRAVTALTKTKLPFVRKDDIHHQTLKSWVKEMVESGKQFPLTLFGAYVGRQTIITKQEPK